MVLPGDLNQDGKIDQDDLKLLREILSEPRISQSVFHTLSPKQKAIVDVNGDGTLSQADLIALTQLVLSKIPADVENDNVMKQKLASLRSKVRS